MFQDNFKLGITKGGQLGKMLIQAAMDFDPAIHILDDDPECPCRNFCTSFTSGNPLNFEVLYQFGKKVDLLTLEIEHVNAEALERLKQESIAVYPDPSIIKIVQDKGVQKKFYAEHGIPTAEFQLIEGKKEILNHSNLLPAVQKTRRAGYDGKGVYKINSAKDMGGAFDEPSVLEKKVPFEKEISVIVTRSRSGELAVFPVIELMFHPQKNLVEFLFSPAKITNEVQEKAKSIACQIATQLAMVGVLAVEMFVLADGQVLVNEIAPRPHNSGHHTIEANVTSQFEQHLRAIVGFPLGDPSMIKPAVMVNLLGEDGFSGPVVYEGIETILKEPGVYVHLYGKKLTKPYRKMGHITVVADTLEEALGKARRIQTIVKVKA